MFALRVACAGLLFLTACASSNKSVAPVRESRAPVHSAPVREGGAYGFGPEDPVRVGWGNEGMMAFLELLRGPEGQRVAWRRLGPSQGLEVFEVTYEGLAAPVQLYLDPLNSGAIRAPSGFNIEGLTSREPLPPEERPQVIEL
ncbi:fibril protein [Pyxidicoccus caerfyrddinensis]|uniref:fibril protein n=1 Tax=Pyxidicoccus caerfyrddinensis TaxID=2709663 RepID=UPI001F084273|nr:fibril protein [Pyxidicoccus caerfyrddinensis]